MNAYSSIHIDDKPNGSSQYGVCTLVVLYYLTNCTLSVWNVMRNEMLCYVVAQSVDRFDGELVLVSHFQVK